MKAPTQIRKPENWQDFEKLCKKLWGEIWDCSTTIKRNGRSGQKQYGVDIYGLPAGENQYRGIQCKGKDDYSKSKLTKNEIDKEISNALDFKPPLKELIFATTADKDVEIEQYIREKNIENQAKGLFIIEIFSWADIVDLLEERRQTYNWYINNCQYKDSTDINVSFDNNSEFEIFPEYFRITKIYKKKPKPNFYNNQLLELNQKINAQVSVDKSISMNFYPWKQKTKVDYRWCTVPIMIKNIGTTVIEDYKLELIFESDKILKVDDKYRPFNPGPLFDQTAVVAQNIELENKREVFESIEYKNVIEIRPKNSVLVQEEERNFKIGIKPKDDINEISVHWTVKSRDYKKEGELSIKVTPKYDDKIEYIEVDVLKENEIEILPKIIEK
jgi:hypothetical protein